MILVPIPMCVLVCVCRGEVGGRGVKQFSVTPPECPTIQLHSDTTYLEIASDSTDNRLTYTKLPTPSHHPLPTSGAHCKPSLSPVLLTNWLYAGGPYGVSFLTPSC